MKITSVVYGEKIVSDWFDFYEVEKQNVLLVEDASNRYLNFSKIYYFEYCRGGLRLLQHPRWSTL